jgi:hypothetical protein
MAHYLRNARPFASSICGICREHAARGRIIERWARRATLSPGWLRHARAGSGEPSAVTL